MHLTIFQLQKYAALAQTLITIGAVVVTSWAAVRGLTTWRQQLLGGVSVEVSRTVLRAVFRIRNTILSIRHRGIFAWEMEGSVTAPGKKLEEADYHRVWQGRWHLFAEVLPDLDTAALEAESLWGGEARDLIDKLSKAIGEYRIDLDQHLLQCGDRGVVQDPDCRRVCDVVYGPSGTAEPDPFKDKLNAIVDEIESYVRPRMVDAPPSRIKRRSHR